MRGWPGGIGGLHGWLGACVVGGGHAWLPGGVHGCWGCAWLLGVCGWQGHAWFVGGVHGWLGGACMVAGGHAWLPGGGMHGCGRGMHRIRRDTVNARAVRILLEYILVSSVFKKY